MRRRTPSASTGCRDDSAEITRLYAHLADATDRASRAETADRLAALIDRDYCRGDCGPCRATWIADAAGRVSVRSADAAAALHRRITGARPGPSTVTELPPRPPR